MLLNTNLYKLDSLKNSIECKRYYSHNGNDIFIEDTHWSFCMVRLRDTTNKFYWSTHILLNVLENHIVRYVCGCYLNTIQIRWENKKLFFKSYYITERNEETSEFEYVDCYYLR